MATIGWWIDAGTSRKFGWRGSDAKIGDYCFRCDRGWPPGYVVTLFERQSEYGMKQGEN